MFTEEFKANLPVSFLGGCQFNIEDHAIPGHEQMQCVAEDCLLFGRHFAKCRATGVPVARGGRGGHEVKLDNGKRQTIHDALTVLGDTHPLADIQQTKHILGPAAYAALALELDQAGHPNIADGEVRWAIEHVPSEVREVLLQMPARQAGNSQLDKILYEPDASIRSRTLPQDA